MKSETREAALCLIQRANRFLVAEITDPQSGAILHRPPGGGVEPGEKPEQAVRRELREELNLDIGTIRSIGAVDHIWGWKGREIHERAWLFLASSSCNEVLARGGTPDLVEADGDRFRTLWRSGNDPQVGLPKLCPPVPREIVETFELCEGIDSIDPVR